jgi:hypothetical protein
MSPDPSNRKAAIRLGCLLCCMDTHMNKRWDAQRAVRGGSQLKRDCPRTVAGSANGGDHINHTLQAGQALCRTVRVGCDGLGIQECENYF